MKTENKNKMAQNKHKAYKKPAIQLYAISPSCFLADSNINVRSNAFDGVGQGGNDDEGR